MSLLTLLTSCGGGGGGGGNNAPAQPPVAMPQPPTAPPPTPPPTPPPPSGPVLDVQRVFPNLSFSQPVALKQAPGDSSRWYIVEQRGVVRVFDNDQATNTANVFLDISAQVNDNFSESGLFAMAFHPGFPSTPEVYLSYTADGGPLTSTLSRFQLDNTGLALDPASEEVLLEIDQPQGNHNGGDLTFGPSGMLYAGFGDGGGGGDPGENAQNNANLLGTVIRINVDGNAPYEIPTDNPFFGPTLCAQGTGAGQCPEIFAWGLRNPWRISFDTLTGALWVGDVGQGQWEEIDRVVLGGNYGWNDREGAHCFDPPSACATGFEEPVTEYDHSVGQSVTGGYVYRGITIAAISGWYVFGDFVSGRIFAIQANSQPTVAPEVVGNAGFNIPTFAEDTDGELYVIDYGGGTIHRIVAGS
jgi:glucose/arabinose dehydrogenase